MMLKSFVVFWLFFLMTDFKFKSEASSINHIEENEVLHQILRSLVNDEEAASENLVACEDSSPFCAGFASKGYCETKSWIVPGCRKSCGVCVVANAVNKRLELLEELKLAYIRRNSLVEFDWDAFRAKLPTTSSAEDKARLKKMFNQFDPRGNGLLSLPEVDKGIKDVLGMDDVFDMKPAIIRAFQIAKDSRRSSRGITGDDYIELKEFKFFLLSLEQYVKYYIAFDYLDSNQDNKITLDEFKDHQEIVEKWVGKIDADEAFAEIDTNNGGFILFDEFCEWAISKNLDLEDANN